MAKLNKGNLSSQLGEALLDAIGIVGDSEIQGSLLSTLDALWSYGYGEVDSLPPANKGYLSTALSSITVYATPIPKVPTLVVLKLVRRQIVLKGLFLLRKWGKWSY